MPTAEQVLAVTEKAYEQVFTGEVLYHKASPYDDYNKDYIVMARVYAGCPFPNTAPALVKNCSDAGDAKMMFYAARKIDPTQLFTDVQRYKPVIKANTAKMSERIKE